MKNTRRTSGFKLTKWYLDFIDLDGNGFIFYAGDMVWKGVSVKYTSQISIGENSENKQYYKANFPVQNETTITWEDSKFKLSGKWTALKPQLHQRIHESDNGYLDWTCYQPASKVEIIRNGIPLSGYGYCEKLVLTDLPWNIDMYYLRWGRYVSENYSLVWIYVEGREDKIWLWLNNELFTEVRITDSKIELNDRSIIVNLNEPVVIESENKIQKLAKDLFLSLPGFNSSLPGRILLAQETKWRSKGELFSNNKKIDEGWVIHEWVNFNSK